MNVIVEMTTVSSLNDGERGKKQKVECNTKKAGE